MYPAGKKKSDQPSLSTRTLTGHPLLATHAHRRIGYRNPTWFWRDIFSGILFLRLEVGHLCPKDRVLNGDNDDLL
jgi:hypothetical protein